MAKTYSDIETHWIVLNALHNNVTYFDSVVVEHISQEIKKNIDKPPIMTYIFRIQAYDSVMCGYFCIGFIDFMLKGKNVTDFTNLFSQNNFLTNDIKRKFFLKTILLQRLKKDN